MKVAIVHDFLNVFGGAERVTLELSKIFPDAPIYTIFYNKKNMDDFFGEKKIVTSSLQKKAEFLGFRHKILLPFMPRAVEEFDLSNFDVVISSQSAWAKGVITKPETIHISYCHTPTRFLWTESGRYLSQQGIKGLRRKVVLSIIDKLRMWDRLAADRVDHWVANSNVTKERIKKYYRKESSVIYPPVDVSRFLPKDKKEDYFLIVSRLSGYKGIDIAIDAFNDLGLPLVVIGDGADRGVLAKRAKKNISFLGFLKDEDIVKYYQGARAFVFPTFDEDFGLTPVEAMACGTPVIAAGRGGSTETIEEGITGVFFKEQTAQSLKEAVKEFIKMEKDFDYMKIRQQAENFSLDVFKEKIISFVNDSYKKGI